MVFLGIYSFLWMIHHLFLDKTLFSFRFAFSSLSSSFSRSFYFVNSGACGRCCSVHNHALTQALFFIFCFSPYEQLQLLKTTVETHAFWGKRKKAISKEKKERSRPGLGQLDQLGFLNHVLEKIRIKKTVLSGKHRQGFFLSLKLLHVLVTLKSVSWKFARPIREFITQAKV